MRPYVIINAAMSADGKIATKERKQLKISGLNDFERVDLLKSNVDAIMVGINTIISDDPSLTIKSEKNIKYRLSKNLPKHPIRIIIDSKCQINLESDILTKDAGERIVFVSSIADINKIRLLEKICTVVICGDVLVDLKKVMEWLYKHGVRTLLVEGGATINYSLLNDNLVDEIYTYIGNIIIGGYNSPTLVDGSGFLENCLVKLKLINFDRVDSGILLKWKVVT